MKIYKRELCAEIWMQSEANVDEEKKNQSDASIYKEAFYIVLA